MRPAAPSARLPRPEPQGRDNLTKKFSWPVYVTGAADADRNRLTAIILNLASDAARQSLEALMTATEWTTHPFIESFKKEGIAEAKAEDVLKLIDAHGIKVTKEQRTEVTESADLAQLDKWFDRALTAKKAADIFRD
jgi:hypothetical protein